jgi:putative component of toxin-antitoxin plasmid stabilization module
MTTSETEVRVYRTPDGRCPLDDWLGALKDFRAIEKIDARIARLRSGNKASQFRDIARAKHHWREHRNANSPLS